jgi:sugar lactone lactonase YvrE
MMARTVELALPWVSQLGESPLWHPADQCLYWVDIAGRQIHRHDPRRQELSHWPCEAEPACLAPAMDGGLAVARRDGLWHLDTRSGRQRQLCEPPYDPALQRFNDGKVDARGDWWLTTIHEPRDRPAAALYRFDGERLHREAEGVTNGNGLAWSIDGQSLWWADTTAHRVDRLVRANEGQGLASRAVFAQFASKDASNEGGQGAGCASHYGGRPDGAAVDCAGRYWVAMYEGARIVCLDAGGVVVDELALPVRCPTMPCFGGADLRTLYITTARHGRAAAELAAEPWAGAVLSVQMEVAGLPACVAGPWV